MSVCSDTAHTDESNAESSTGSDFDHAQESSSAYCDKHGTDDFRDSEPAITDVGNSQIGFKSPSAIFPALIEDPLQASKMSSSKHS